MIDDIHLNDTVEHHSLMGPVISVPFPFQIPPPPPPPATIASTPEINWMALLPPPPAGLHLECCDLPRPCN